MAIERIIKKTETWSGGYNGTPMFDRGFTGHEHMTAFGLINMNGRCYDPLTSSFQFWRICNPPTSNISIFNAKHLRNNILIHIFAEKTAFYEKPSYIFRGLQIPRFCPSGLQIRWNGGDQDQLHLQYSPDVQPKQVELYDLQGRLVRVQQSDLEHVDLQGL